MHRMPTVGDWCETSNLPKVKPLLQARLGSLSDTPHLITALSTPGLDWLSRRCYVIVQHPCCMTIARDTPLWLLAVGWHDALYQVLVIFAIASLLVLPQESKTTEKSPSCKALVSHQSSCSIPAKDRQNIRCIMFRLRRSVWCMDPYFDLHFQL
jgi:hypothetical protein